MNPTHHPRDFPPALIDDLVAANRILYHQGVVDGFGHVSARHSMHSDAFLLSRSMAPALVTAQDIQALDFDGNNLTGDLRPSYLERFIHAEIYRRRADVGAVVHSHSLSVIPFGVVGEVPLRPVYHMGGFLGAGVPIFEIRDTAGDASDMLIRDSRLGAALAQRLGASAVILMRGHGSTAVGTSVRHAVFRAVYTELSARIQAEALRLGKPNYLTTGEAAAAGAVNERSVDRAWDLWRQQATSAE
jgi:ribulose-5-phosphate 4-epimerase/fuculose-1-phosphate aldolase